MAEQLHCPFSQADEPEYDDEDRFSPHIFEPELVSDSRSIHVHGLTAIIYCQTESHLEQCVELLGPVPVQVLDQGLHSGEWFDGNGALLSVPDMQYGECCQFFFCTLVSAYHAAR